MKDITICKINESVLEIKAEDDILHNLYSRYSAYQAGYQFNPKFKCRIWDGKVHLFNIRTGILPIGFLFDVLQYCRTNNYSFDLEGITLEDLRHTIDEQTYQQQILDNMKNSGRTLRPYQDEAVRKALTFRKGILLSCTSSGKSMMLYNIIRNIRREGFKKILLIVPNILLIKQMYDDFVDYGYDNYELELTKMGGDETPDMSAPVLISTWQSLQNKSADFFEDFDAVFVDECHGSQAKKLFGIIGHCVNARIKIGTTGTLPTDAAELLKVQSVLGSVIFELKSKELIDQGVLTQLQIANVILKYPLEFIMANKGRAYQEEVRLVEDYSGRNKALEFILHHTPSDHNILVLVNHIKHLNDIKKWCEEAFPEREVNIISGAVKGKERDEIRVGVENKNGLILLATYQTMSTGVNIPKLHDVVLYANSKSKIKVLQSIGRGLRRHVTKNKIVLYDIVDDLSYQTSRGRVVENYLLKHWKERLEYYREQEFPFISTSINI